MSNVTYEVYQDRNTFERVILAIALRSVDRLTVKQAQHVQDTRGYHCIDIVRGAEQFADNEGYNWPALNNAVFSQFIVDCQNILAEVERKL